MTRRRTRKIRRPSPTNLQRPLLSGAAPIQGGKRRRGATGSCCVWSSGSAPGVRKHTLAQEDAKQPFVRQTATRPCPQESATRPFPREPTRRHELESMSQCCGLTNPPEGPQGPVGPLTASRRRRSTTGRTAVSPWVGGRPGGRRSLISEGKFATWVRQR